MSVVSLLVVAWLAGAGVVQLAAVATMAVAIQGIVSMPDPGVGVPPEPCLPVSTQIPCRQQTQKGSRQG